MREAFVRGIAHALDAEKHCHAERDRSTVSVSVKRRFHALARARVSRCFMPPDPSGTTRLIAGKSTSRSKLAASRWSWLTNSSVLAHRSHCARRSCEERLPRIRIQRGRRLVGDDELGRADERARRGHALLLADRKLGRLAPRRLAPRPIASSKMQRGIDAASRASRRPVARASPRNCRAAARSAPPTGRGPD